MYGMLASQVVPAIMGYIIVIVQVARDLWL